MPTPLHDLLETRFGAPAPTAGDTDNDVLRRIAARGSCRAFKDEKIPANLIRTLCAVALCAPAKSDLQQRDIIIVDDAGLRAQLDALLTGGPLLGQPWIAGAPHLLVFCGNNRRQRQLHAWRGKPFVNDHLDAFYNAALDAGIAMATFIIAAEAVGLGCCPISAIRNEAAKVSDLLALPDHVFPAVALALGRPAQPPPVSLRLPLEATVHQDRFSDAGIEAAVTAYDASRAAAQPYATQRYTDEFGSTDPYTWSEDKARQYTKPERASFGAFVRAKGFDLG